MPRGVSISVSPDGFLARISVPAHVDPASLTVEDLTIATHVAGVMITPEVEEAIAAYVNSYMPGQGRSDAIIARAVRPTAGVDGMFEWAPAFDPARGGDRIDHRPARVARGEVVGVLRLPTDGENGRDVVGRLLKATRGKPAPVTLHESLTHRPDGRVTAEADGTPAILGGQLRVWPVREVRGPVAHATGNIDFPGAVVVAGGVHSGLRVKADGDLYIDGVIEAAHVACGGDLIARSGVLGLGQARLSVGNDLHTTRLQDATGVVAGSLFARDGLTGCNLEICSRLHALSGGIVGGTVHAAGPVRVGRLGSADATPTTLVLACVPLLQATYDNGQREEERLAGAMAALTHEESALKLDPAQTGRQRERLRELRFEIEATRRELDETSRCLADLARAIEAGRTLDVQVGEFIFKGVTLQIGPDRVIFADDVAGPVTIWWDSGRQPRCRIGPGPEQPLDTIARVVGETPAAA